MDDEMVCVESVLIGKLWHPGKIWCSICGTHHCHRCGSCVWAEHPGTNVERAGYKAHFDAFRKATRGIRTSPEDYPELRNRREESPVHKECGIDCVLCDGLSKCKMERGHPERWSHICDNCSLTPRQSKFFEQYRLDDDDATQVLSGHLAGGKMLGVMNSRQALKMGVYLIDKAKTSIILTCFTFNVQEVSDALIRASKRKVEVTVIADQSHTLNGATQAQAQRMSELVEHVPMITVRLTSGVGGKSGIQHSKTLLVDSEHLSVGSCNWTTNSRANEEINVLVQLTKAGAEQYDRRVQYLLMHSLPYKGVLEERSHATREARAGRKATDVKAKAKMRATSEPASGRPRKNVAEYGKFAKGFSLARERKVNIEIARARAGETEDEEHTA